MSLTQRTIRISLAALFSIILANFIGLANPMAAGIIAILSILDTRLETIKVALARLLSTLLAFAVATVVFSAFGFSVYSFGLYLAIYVPLAYLGKVDAGIAPCSVLVTHFVIAESIALSWQLNGLLLMMIGLGFALSFNLWMPSHDEKLDRHVQEIEKQMTLVLFLIEKHLEAGSHSIKRIRKELRDLYRQILAFEDLAVIDYENRTFSKAVQNYYVKYAQMRKQQYEILARISELLSTIIPNTEENRILASIIGETAEQLDEQNPGTNLLKDIASLYAFFQEYELPKTRREFESRAMLYYILTDFEKFLLLKQSFYVKYGKPDRADNLKKD